VEKNFIIALAEHRVLGFVLVPYVIEGKPADEYYSITERITTTDLRLQPDRFSEIERKIVKTLDEYNDNELVRVFSKKRVTVQDFLNGISDELFQKQIRPYIEKRIVRCLDLIIQGNIPLFYKDSPKQIYLTDRIKIEPQSAEAVFNFSRGNDGIRYFLTVSHKNQEMNLTNTSAIVLTNDPCRLVIKNKLLVFNDIDGKKLSPFFKTDYIHIPPQREKEYFEKFIINAIKKFRVKNTGFEIIEEFPEPTIILSLEGDLAYHSVLALRFDYGRNVLVSTQDHEKVFVVLQNQDNAYKLFKINRKLEKEKDISGFLTEKGLQVYQGGFYNLLHETQLTKDEEISELVNWLNLHTPLLEKKKIQIQQNFFEKKYFLNPINIETKVHVRGDWFDIQSIVHLGGYQIPFIKFRNHILQNSREYQLPNGEVMILPKEWFSKYADLMLFSKKGEEFISISKLHYKLLEKTIPEAGIQDSSGAFYELMQSEQYKAENIPTSIKAELRPYQKEGYYWMYLLYLTNLGGCLADDMGLGKTLQTLTIITKAREEAKKAVHIESKGKKVAQPTLFDISASPVPASLIVLPSSLVHNWANEIVKFAPHLKLLKHIGGNRETDFSGFDKYDIILTTYGVVRNEIEWLSKYEFFYVVLDESQIIKNPESKVFQAVIELKSKHRLVLTGTPIENSLSDLWSQMHFVNPGLLGELSFFRQNFLTPIEKEGNTDRQQKLQQLIRPFILRRTKGEVASDLPELTEQIRYCNMTESQKAYYEEEKSKARNKILDSISSVGIEKSALLVLQALTRLRQIANHPFMVDPDYSADSGKFEEVISNIENMIAEDHKVLIFSSFVKHLDLFKKYFDNNQRKYSMLIGETRNREEVIKQFQADPENRFFLISLKAGGVGLNLTAADYVFILDPWWNPAAEMQAISRSHRIGQTQNVFVYRYISVETVEEKIVRLQERKSELADLFINSNNPFQQISREEIMDLFE
jgi:superfamily II DNA or RNA helicase